MRRTPLVGVVALGLLVVLAVGAQAGRQSYFGPTGLLLTPTAEIPGTLGFMGSAYFVDDSDDTTAYALTGGFMSFEGSLARLEGDGAETLLDLKYQYRPMSGLGTSLLPFDVAVGVIDLTDELDQSFYVVSSMPVNLGAKLNKQIPSFKANLGVGGGFFDGMFYGVELGWNNGLGLIGEYDSDDWNWGIEYNLPSAEGLKFTLAEARDNKMIGVTYSLLKGF